MKSKKLILGILAMTAIFSGTQILGTGSMVCDGMIKRNTGATPINLESQTSCATCNKAIRHKVNIVTLEERLSALYPRQ